MNQDAIVTLKGKTGSSRYAVAKFIEDKQKNLPYNFKRLSPVQLKKLMASGKFVKVKTPYKLPPSQSKPATAPVKKKPLPASKAAASATATQEVKPTEKVGKKEGVKETKAKEQTEAEAEAPAAQNHSTCIRGITVRSHCKFTFASTFQSLFKHKL